MKSFEKTNSRLTVNGWVSETKTIFNGQGWVIITSKNNSNLIVSYARKVKFNDVGDYMFNISDVVVQLLKTDHRATEKTIKNEHTRALIAFDQYIKDNPEQEQAYTIEVGQRVFLDGYGKSQFDGNQIIYDIKNDTFGPSYFTVDTITLELKQVSHLRPFSQKFGIGTYYIENDVFKGTIDELNNIVIEAQAHKRKEQEREESATLLKNQVRKGKIEEGKKLITIPDNAKFAIVADLYQDESDSMTDYFHTTVEKRVYLGFSTTNRNNMKELRKAALLFEETAHFPKEADENKENKDYNKVCEYTYGHPNLPDYFLGTQNWYGWKVTKRKYEPLEMEKNREEIYIAAAEGRFCFPEAKEEPQKINASDFEIIEYSEKAIALVGNTKSIKESLKSLGGRWNSKLSCGAGWIFPKTKRLELINLLGSC